MKMNKGLSWSTAVSIALVLLVMSLLAACQATPSPEVIPEAPVEIPQEVVQPEAPAEVGASRQLIISEVADISTLDPKYRKGREDQNALRLMFDSLFHRDDNMQIIPWLAHDVENPDDLTWRFHLRQDVKFHNGNDFKANDVKFTLERLMEDDSVWTNRDFVDRIEIVDEYTVDVITKDPYAAFMTNVVLWHMTDEEYFNEVGEEGYLNAPVGTGPFKFVEWVKAEQVVFEANEDYWRGAPQTQTIIFRPIPEAATRIAALETGGVDIIVSVPPEYINQVGRGVEIATIPGTRAFFLGMNVNVEPFNDVRVRQAMNYAVDVDAIIEFVLNGLARRIDNPILPEAFGYTPTPVYQYDPEKALSLLEDAGYPDGFEFTIDTIPTMKEIAEAIAGQLSEVGIVANVDIMENAAFVARYEPGLSQSYLSSWGNSEADADGILSKQFYSKRYGCDLVTFSYPDPRSGYDDAVKGCYYTGYGNAEVDAAVEEGKTNVDAEARKAAYSRAIDTIVEETPWVFLYNPSEIYAHRGVNGWTPRSDALFNLETAWIED
jgi:peptide/nickel transport system substrate-binding protein